MKLSTYGQWLALLLLSISCQTSELRFGKSNDFPNPDSIVLTFSFFDGDGNLGFNMDNITPALEEFSDPFNEENFFLATGNGQLEELGTNLQYLDTIRNGVEEFVPLTILNTKGNTGHLVSNKSRNLPSYAFLPEVQNDKLGCKDYTTQRIFLPIADHYLLDESTNIINTVTDQNNNQFLQVRDTLYFKVNPYHYNIEIDILVKEPDNTFKEFDWRENYCSTFDGRFRRFEKGKRFDYPFIIDAASSKSGTITYSMASIGFRIIFANKTLKLRFSIRDKALNTSNIVETPEFSIN